VWHVSGPRNWLGAGTRIRGWREELASHRRVAHKVIVCDNWNVEAGYRAAQHLLSNQEVTAIFGSASDSVGLPQFALVGRSDERGGRRAFDVARDHPLMLDEAESRMVSRARCSGPGRGEGRSALDCSYPGRWARMLSCLQHAIEVSLWLERPLVAGPSGPGHVGEGELQAGRLAMWQRRLRADDLRRPDAPGGPRPSPDGRSASVTWRFFWRMPPEVGRRSG